MKQNGKPAAHEPLHFTLCAMATTTTSNNKHARTRSASPPLAVSSALALVRRHLKLRGGTSSSPSTPSFGSRNNVSPRNRCSPRAFTTLAANRRAYMRSGTSCVQDQVEELGREISAARLRHTTKSTTARVLPFQPPKATGARPTLRALGIVASALAGSLARSRGRIREREVTKKALSFLRQRLFNDGWCATHRDSAFYFRAPNAFLAAGRPEDARRAFERLRPHLDACANDPTRLFWAARAARLLGLRDDAALLDAMLLEAASRRPSSLEEDYAAAVLTLHHAANGRPATAAACADAIAAHAMASPSQGGETAEKGGKGGEGGKRGAKVQLAMVHALLHAAHAAGAGEPRARAWREAAKRLLDRVARREGGWGPHVGKNGDSNMEEEGDGEGEVLPMLCLGARILGRDVLSWRCASRLLSQQRHHGGMREDADAAATVDRTAEAVCLLKLAATFKH